MELLNNPILRYLDTKFENVKSKEIKLLEGLSFRFTEPVIAFRKFADRIGVSAEAARAFLAISPPSSYVAVDIESEAGADKGTVIGAKGEDAAATATATFFCRPVASFNKFKPELNNFDFTETPVLPIILEISSKLFPSSMS